MIIRILCDFIIILSNNKNKGMKELNKEDFYSHFISLFKGSKYPYEKRIKWATYSFCRIICSPLIEDKLFEKNIIILFLSFTHKSKAKSGTDIKELNQEKKSEVISILKELI